jgi:peptide/nickel transport system substrate-binding protein
MNYLNAVGIRLAMKQMERATFYADWQAHKAHGIFQTAAGNPGNAASRVEAFIYSKGAYTYGGYDRRCVDEPFRSMRTSRSRIRIAAQLALSVMSSNGAV